MSSPAPRARCSSRWTVTGLPASCFANSGVVQLRSGPRSRSARMRSCSSERKIGNAALGDTKQGYQTLKDVLQDLESNASKLEENPRAGRSPGTLDELNDRIVLSTLRSTAPRERQE